MLASDKSIGKNALMMLVMWKWKELLLMMKKEREVQSSEKGERLIVMSPRNAIEGPPDVL